MHRLLYKVFLGIIISCFIMTEFEHTGQIVRLYEMMNSFSVPVQIIGKREDASLLQRIQMGAEMDAAGEVRGQVRRWDDGKMGRWEEEGGRKRRAGGGESEGRERQPGVNTEMVENERWR